MKVVVFNLGCKVNQYESDVLINLLEQKGHSVSNELEYADCYIINTCAVTNEAEKKSRQCVARARKFNKNAKIFICGCASQKNPLQFSEKDNVVTVIGVAQKDTLVNLIESGENITELPKIYEDYGTAKSFRTRSYVKIQDGCNNFCSYCIIPYLRGRERSRSIESIVKELEIIQNVSAEIVLTGINLSSYGKDINTNLAALIKRLININSRLRFGSLEVRIINDELLTALKNLKDFCPQFHLSMQTGDDKVLHDMNRHYTTDEFYEKVCLIRKYFPNAGITTDIIVGFPTETEENFENTLNFVKKVKFSNIHIFPYSARKGTNAYGMKLIDKSIIKEREKKLKVLKDKLQIEFNSQFIGKNVEVLFEEELENGYYIGYTKEYVKVYTKNEINLKKLNIIKIKGEFQDGLLG